MKLAHVSSHVGAHVSIEGNELAGRLSMLYIQDHEARFVPYDGLDRVNEMSAVS
jgi:hypothetical protein